MKAGEIRIARMRVNKKRIKDLEKKKFGVAVGIQGNAIKCRPKYGSYQVTWDGAIVLLFFYGGVGA